MSNHLLKLILGLIILTCFTSCNSRDIKIDASESNQVESSLNSQSDVGNIDIIQLTKDKWYNAVTSDCMNHLIFKEDYHYTEDNCEWKLTFEGKYEISKDTLLLMQYGLASDLPGENRMVNTGIYTYIYQGDSLLFIRNQQMERGKIIATYHPESPVYFRREK